MEKLARDLAGKTEEEILLYFSERNIFEILAPKTVADQEQSYATLGTRMQDELLKTAKIEVTIQVPWFMSLYNLHDWAEFSMGLTKTMSLDNPLLGVAINHKGLIREIKVSDGGTLGEADKLK
jgi:hypothetical protein